MPILNDFRQTKIIELPSYPDSKVEIYDSMLVGDLSKLNFKSEVDVKVSIEVLPFIIKSWNFTNEKGEPLAITVENLNFLKLDDMTAIFTAVTEFAKESKKK